MHIYNIIFIIVGAVFGIAIFARCYMCCCLKNKGVIVASATS